MGDPLMVPASLLAKWAEQFDEHLSDKPFELPVDLLPPPSQAEHRSRAAALMLEIVVDRRGCELAFGSAWLRSQIANPLLGISRSDIITLLRGIFKTEVEKRNRVSWRTFQGFGFSSEELQLASNHDRLRLGQVLWDEIVLQERVAEGGVVVVYRAVTSDGISLAIKVPRKFEDAGDDLFARALREEVHVLSRLQIPGIPRRLAFREWNSIPILATEWIDSPGGAGFPKEATRDEKLQYIARLSRIVDQLHRRELIHGDIKPQNFMVDKKDRVWLLDFNISRSAIKSKGEFFRPLPGTYQMMNPESLLFLGSKADMTQDLYALGCMAYEAVAGTPLHKGRGRAESLVATLLLNWPSVLEFPTDTPEPLQTLCQIAVSTDTCKRFSTALDFADTIDRVLLGNLNIQEIPPLRPRIGAWRLGDALGKGFVHAVSLAHVLARSRIFPVERISSSDRNVLSNAADLLLAINEASFFLKQIGGLVPPLPDLFGVHNAILKFNIDLLAREGTGAEIAQLRELPLIQSEVEKCVSWFVSIWKEIVRIETIVPQLALLAITAVQAHCSGELKSDGDHWNKLARLAKLPNEIVERFNESLSKDIVGRARGDAAHRLNYDVMKWLRWENAN